jgi:hypothetical protein
MMQNQMAFNPFYGGGSMFEHIAMKNIVDPRDVDVLCGRGGAALRHPGNQTYRRLVNMNKAIYTTCLKTEKLKISRSIVAAIREQRGRFLEREGNFGTWYDIGDKKAIEKTSQALREGQPKLRQKMVEDGSNTTVPTVSLANQFAKGMVPGMANPQMAAAAAAQMQLGIPPPPAQSPLPPQQHQMLAQQQILAQQQMMAQQQMLAQQQLNAQQQQMNNMATPQQANRKTNQELSDMMMQRLNLSNQGSIPLANHVPSNADDEEDRLEVQQRELEMQLQQQQLQDQEQKLQEQQRQLAEQQKRLEEQQQQLERQQQQATVVSSMQEPAGTMQANQKSGDGGLAQNGPVKEEVPGNSESRVKKAKRSGQMNPQGEQARSRPPPPAPSSNSKEGEGGVRKLDRRRLFARMKFNRTASGRLASHSTTSLGKTSDMPDIHMVDSTFSLLSNISSGMCSDSKEHNDHARRDEYMVAGSRRSMMSGISNNSDGNSIFSDLSKKIGNVSTRSIAMSEISGIEEGNHEDLDESFHFDPPTQLSRGFEEEESSLMSRSSRAQMPV